MLSFPALAALIKGFDSYCIGTLILSLLLFPFGASASPVFNPNSSGGGLAMENALQNLLTR